MSDQKDNFVEYLDQGTEGFHSSSWTAFSTAPQTLLHTLASYSHSNSQSLHSISYTSSFFFPSVCFSFWSPRRFLQSTTQPHQSTNTV